MKFIHFLLLFLICQKNSVYGSNGFIDALPFPEDGIDTFVDQHTLAFERNEELTILAQKYGVLPIEISAEQKHKILSTLREIDIDERETKLKLLKEILGGQDSRYGLPKNDFQQRGEAHSKQQAIIFFQQIYVEQLEEFCSKVCLFLEGKRYTKTQDGTAFEVHEYMKTAQNTQESTSVEKAILGFIKTELEQKEGFILLGMEASITCFIDWLNQQKMIEGTTITKIKSELQNIQDVDTVRYIICFVFTLNDEERDAYFSTFVSESLHAFEGKKQESCSKGVEERLFTSFRALTTFPFFANLFQLAETQHLARVQKQNFFKQFGIDNNTQKLTKALHEAFLKKSITKNNATNEIVSAYKEIATAYFAEKGISIDSNLQEEIDNFADIFENPNGDLW